MQHNIARKPIPNTINQPTNSYFAHVTSGVENLTVSATVFSPSQEETELALRDDGLIVPDVTEGDGIYSQYYFDLVRVGFYSAEVNVVDESTGQ